MKPSQKLQSCHKHSYIENSSWSWDTPGANRDSGPISLVRALSFPRSKKSNRNISHKTMPFSIALQRVVSAELKCKYKIFLWWEELCVLVPCLLKDPLRWTHWQEKAREHDLRICVYSCPFFCFGSDKNKKHSIPKRNEVAPCQTWGPQVFPSF